MLTFHISTLLDFQLINLFQDISIWELLREPLGLTNALMAQALSQDYDILADGQEAFDNFIESGQAWALGIGLVIGYMFRAFTSY